MLEEMEIGKLVTEGLQMRAGLSRATVAEYVEEMKSHVAFPPLRVIKDETSLFLVDWFHRLAAMKRLGYKTATCEVSEGTFADALRAALGANAAHGLRRTNADKRHALESAWANRSLLFGGEPTHNQLAEACAVSRSSARRFREGVLKEQPRRTEDAGREDGAPRDHFGLEIPERLRGAFADNRLKAIAEAINSLRHELADEIEGENPAFAQVTQQTQIAFSNAYHDLKASAPFCICRNCRGEGCHTCAKTGFQTKAQYERLPAELKSSL